MKETIYIFSSGDLKRHDNSLLFVSENGEKKYLPVENTKEIMVFGEVNINKRLLNFMSEKEIILSYFNYYGYYMGSFYPREHNNSGYMILQQAKAYLNPKDRLILAKKFVEGALKNSLKVLGYYRKKGLDLEQSITTINEVLRSLENTRNIEQVMALEAQAKRSYYTCFNEIVKNEEFKFSKRSRKPPKDYINTLISFSNSLVYSIVLRDIYSTHLDPRIGYLHSTNFRRFTLNLDVAEIFKPVIGDRTIFSLVNRGKIKPNDFETALNGIFLNASGKRKFLEVFEEKLHETFHHKRLNRKVSYRELIRLELYKIEKHLMQEETYTPFVMGR